MYNQLDYLIGLVISTVLWPWIRMMKTGEFFLILMLITRRLNFSIMDSWVLLTVIAHII